MLAYRPDCFLCSHAVSVLASWPDCFLSSLATAVLASWPDCFLPSLATAVLAYWPDCFLPSLVTAVLAIWPKEAAVRLQKTACSSSESCTFSYRAHTCLSFKYQVTNGCWSELWYLSTFKLCCVLSNMWSHSDGSLARCKHETQCIVPLCEVVLWFIYRKVIAIVIRFLSRIWFLNAVAAIMNHVSQGPAKPLHM